MKNIFRTLATIIALMICVSATLAGPRIVQTATISFPRAGRVIVQAIEEFDHNPRIVLRAAGSRRILLDHSLTAPDEMLIPRADETPAFNPFLRFRILGASCFGTPLVLATAVVPGGSDHGFYTSVIGETDGQINALLSTPLQTNVQGGIWLGRLNRENACGLAVWNFIWDDGAHYDLHPYSIEIHPWRDGRLATPQKHETRRKYSGNGSAALKELGIHATDQRNLIVKVRQYLQ